MSGYVSQPSMTASPAYFGGPAAVPVSSPAVPQVLPTGVNSSQAMVGDAWSPNQTSLGTGVYPQPVAPLTSPPTPLGPLSTFDQLLARLGSLTHQGMSILGQFCSTVADFFRHRPSPPPSSAPPPPSHHGATRFVLSSFNVLSSAAGKGKGYAPGPARIHDVANILKANAVEVVGFQEMDHTQLAEFKKVAGDDYATFAGASGIRGYHDTTLAWRKDRWKLVKAATLTVPSYEGRDSRVPYVRLRNKQTGQEAYFIDVHNPANTRRHHHQEGYRDAAARQEAALAKQLFEQSGLPVFIVGDMNSVREAEAIFTSGAPVKAANPDRKSGIDWIFGTKDVQFGQFRRERGGLIGKTTDHPVVFTNVKIGTQ